MAGDCSSNRSDDAGQSQAVQCSMQLLPLGPACTNSTPLRLRMHASRLIRGCNLWRATLRNALFIALQRAPFKSRPERSTVGQHCFCHEDREREGHQQWMPIEDPGCVSGVCSGADCCECQTSKIFKHPHRDQDKRCKLTSARQPCEPSWRRGTQESLCNTTIFVFIDCHPCWCYTSRSHSLQCTT